MVKIYAIDITGLPDPIDAPALLEGMEPRRKAKTLRYRQEISRKQSLGAGYLLKHCFDFYGKSIEDINYGSKGKPEVEGIYFNISHSDEIVVLAVSEKKTGCDIEKIKPKRLEIARRYFTERENCYLDALSEDAKMKGFYRLWTIKESFTKMTGEGIARGMNQCEIQFSDGVIIFYDNKKQTCSLKEYDIKGFCCTVCTEDNEFDEEIIWLK